MLPNTPCSSDDAFDLLCRTAKQRIGSIQEDVNEAVRQGEYGRAQEYLKQAQELADLLGDLATMAERFKRLIELTPPVATDEGGRLSRGLKTPQREYRVPILQALMELGGEANLNLVLDRVYELMRDRLNEHDLASLHSDESIPRWRNTAQWARNALREEGFIRSDTPRGIWAISDKGRRWLEEMEGNK